MHRFKAWPKIGKLGDCIAGNTSLDDGTYVRFVAKVKLHGTNAGVQYASKSKSIRCQSRHRFLQATADTERMSEQKSDNYGFARWVNETLAACPWADIAAALVPGDAAEDLERFTIFGEWVGQGIAGTSDACNLLPQRMWFIFSICVETSARTLYIYDTKQLEHLLAPMQSSAATPGTIHIMPFVGDEPDNINSKDNTARIFEMRLGDRASQQEMAKQINAIVHPMEQRDFYIHEQFGINGPGEGLVLIPLTLNPTVFCEWMFKAKTPHHSETQPIPAAKGAKDASAKHTSDAVDLHTTMPRPFEYGYHFVTGARCEKILAALLGPADNAAAAAAAVPSESLRASFVAAVTKDVEEESARVRKEQQHEWASVSKYVSGDAHKWFTRRLKTGVFC